MRQLLQVQSPMRQEGSPPPPPLSPTGDPRQGNGSFSLQVPCMRCISKQLICEPRAARRSGNNPPHDQNYRALQPQKQVEPDSGSGASKDLANNSGVRPLPAGPQVPQPHLLTTTAAEPLQPSPGPYSPPFQVQQWTLDNLSSEITLPQDWLAEISRQVEIEQISDSLPTSEWGSSVQMTPAAMMSDWHNPHKLDFNMTGLIGGATEEPHGRGLFDDNMALDSSDSQGSRKPVAYQDSAEGLFPNNFRPKSKACFSQARINLERLEHILKTQNQWFGGYFHSIPLARTEAKASIESMSDTTRDQLLVVTQLLLQQSRIIHFRHAASSDTANIHPLNAALITLPPTRVFDAMIESYCNCFEKYFRLCPGPLFTPNEIFTQLPQHGKVAGILLLLMIAVGAAAIPSTESHHFAIGVADMCRLAFSEILERDFSITVEPLISQCALLLLYLGMWAGERWLMGVRFSQLNDHNIRARFAKKRHTDFKCAKRDVYSRKRP